MAPTKNRIALKGQSRSKFCAEPIRTGSKSRCARLAGHKGTHRKSMSTRSAKPTAPNTAPAETPKEPVRLGVMDRILVAGVWYDVVVVDGQPVLTAVPPVVTVVPEQAPKERIGVSGPVGRSRPAKRGRGAHRSGKPSARLA